MIETLITLPMRVNERELAKDILSWTAGVGSYLESAGGDDEGIWIAHTPKPFGVGQRNYVQVTSTLEPYGWYRDATQAELEYRADRRFQLPEGRPLASWDDALAVVVEEELETADRYVEYPEGVHTLVQIKTDSLAGAAGEDVLWEHLVYAMRLRGHVRLGTFGEWKYPDGTEWRMLASQTNNPIQIADIRGRGESKSTAAELMVAAERRINLADISGGTSGRVGI